MAALDSIITPADHVTEDSSSTPTEAKQSFLEWKFKHRSERFIQE